MLMLLVGRYLLPLLGTPQFDVGLSLAPLVVAVSSALAACGFRDVGGVVARSFDQAAILSGFCGHCRCSGE